MQSTELKEKDETLKRGSKRRVTSLMWNWKEKASATKTKDPVPEKKQKFPSKNKPEKMPEKYSCLQCLEISLRGKRDEKFSSLCRNDASSLNRHKARWHNTDATNACIVVPASAPEMKALRNRYAKSRAVNIDALSSRPSVPISALDESSTPLNKPERPVVKISSTVEPEPSSQDPKESIPLSKGAPTSQATMFSYSRPAEESGSSKEVTLTTVVEAISSLPLKVENWGKHHATLEQLAFEDDDVRKTVLVMKETKNIRQLADVSETIQFFYDEESEAAVFRCLPCFKMHLAARPTLSDLSPFQVHRIINSSSNGTLGTGIL